VFDLVFKIPVKAALATTITAIYVKFNQRIHSEIAIIFELIKQNYATSVTGL